MNYATLSEHDLDAEHYRLRKAIEQAYAMNDLVSIAKLERDKALVSHFLYLHEADRVRQQAVDALYRFLHGPVVTPEVGQQILDLLARHKLRLVRSDDAGQWSIWIGDLHLEVTADADVWGRDLDDYAPGLDADLKAFEVALLAKEE